MFVFSLINPTNVLYKPPSRHCNILGHRKCTILYLDKFRETKVASNLSKGTFLLSRIHNSGFIYSIFKGFHLLLCETKNNNKKIFKDLRLPIQPPPSSFHACHLVKVGSKKEQGPPGITASQMSDLEPIINQPVPHFPSVYACSCVT